MPGVRGRGQKGVQLKGRVQHLACQCWEAFERHVAGNTPNVLCGSSLSDVWGCPEDAVEEVSHLAKFEIELMQEAISRRLSVCFLLGHPLSKHRGIEREVIYQSPAVGTQLRQESIIGCAEHIDLRQNS